MVPRSHDNLCPHADDFIACVSHGLPPTKGLLKKLIYSTIMQMGRFRKIDSSEWSVWIERRVYRSHSGKENIVVCSIHDRSHFTFVAKLYSRNKLNI